MHPARLSALVFDEQVDPDDKRLLISQAQRALVAMRLGKEDEAIRQMGVRAPLEGAESVESGDLEKPGAAEQQNHLGTRALMLLLFSECSAMVSSLGDGGKAPIMVQVFDDYGAEVSIDQADPPVRTAVRTLLAEVHGNTEAAAEQLEIALENAVPEEVEILVAQALRWTMRLCAECVERKLSVSSWVAKALID
jgi:hypothetical protein